MTFAWTDMAKAELVRLHPDKTLSYSMLAAELVKQFGGELTRNAIVGKVHRLGLEKRGKAVSHLKARVTRGPRIKRTGAFPMPATAPLPDLSQHDQAIPESQRKSLLELTGTTCRWAVGHPGDADFFFCGGPADLGNGRPYCNVHHRFSYIRAKPVNVYAFRG